MECSVPAMLDITSMRLSVIFSRVGGALMERVLNIFKPVFCNKYGTIKKMHLSYYLQNITFCMHVYICVYLFIFFMTGASNS